MCPACVGQLSHSLRLSRFLSHSLMHLSLSPLSLLLSHAPPPTLFCPICRKLHFFDVPDFDSFFLINFFKRRKKLPKMTKGQTGVFKVQDVPIFFFNSFKFLSKKHFKKLFGKLTNYFKGRINSFPHMW